MCRQAAACGIVWGVIALDDTCKVVAIEQGVFRCIIATIFANLGDVCVITWCLEVLAYPAHGTTNTVGMHEQRGRGCCDDDADGAHGECGIVMVGWQCLDGLVEVHYGSQASASISASR